MRFTTNLVNIYQFQRTGAKEDYPASPNYNQVNACITPAGTDLIMTYGGEAGFQLYEIFVYDMTIQFKNGDKIVDEAGHKYLVQGVAQVVNNRYMSYTKLAANLEV